VRHPGHCQRGDEYIVGQMQHCYRWEGGGAAVFGSVQPQPLETSGRRHACRWPTSRLPSSPTTRTLRAALLALENTLGGKLMPMDYVQAGHGAGAAPRPGPPSGWCAAVQRGGGAGAQTGGDARAEAKRIAQNFDSVSVCFSKGLGAPVGSALCGSRDFIARAHRIRKMAGGGMRQAGMLAAAAAYALDHQVDRLADDHALAQRLAAGLAGIDGVQVEPPHTNIVFVDLTGPARDKAAGLLPHLAAQGIQATGLYRLRFVTHLDVDAAGVDRAVAAIRQYFRA
jgi:threonine aldolase